MLTELPFFKSTLNHSLNHYYAIVVYIFGNEMRLRIHFCHQILLKIQIRENMAKPHFNPFFWSQLLQKQFWLKRQNLLKII